MRDILIGVGLLTLAVIAWTFVITTESNAESHSNQVMKQCLEKHGYKQENFQTYDFSKAAKCHSDFRIAQKEKDNEKMRDFLADHPWYKGKNWKWEQRAEYTCVKRMDMGGIELCTRPYYLN